MNKKFYVTTPIYYVTAKPHLGSLYSTLLADVIARWNKLQGKDVFFLTGTDEHGQKIAQAAEKAGKEPQDFVDSFVPEFKNAWNIYDIEYSKFMRTTDDYHVKGAQHLVSVLMQKDYIYKSEYKGWYCTPCETFVAELTEENELLAAPQCSSCGRETHIISEESYFFKLSAFTEKLLAFYKANPDFIVPKERSHEVISFVESGLKDLSISRTTVKWGVPFPQDPLHTVYVWVEALSNYITGVGYGQPDKQDEFNAWWPADVQILGKDIIKFHAVYWPAILMAADLPLPKKLLVHGWIKVNQQKMSKSLGNVIDPIELQKKYGTDAIRYYLMRQIPVNQDGDFSIEDVENRIESDLANDLGNLLNRMVALAEKYGITQVVMPEHGKIYQHGLQANTAVLAEKFNKHMNDYMFHHALASLWEYIHAVNKYFHELQPWKIAQNDPQQFMMILFDVCNSLYWIALLLWPIMPQKMEELLSSLGIQFKLEEHMLKDFGSNWNITPLHEFTLKKVPTLFEKPIKEIAQQTMPVGDTVVSPLPDNYITIDDVAKVELRTGTIENCVEVAGSDKLLQMTVDLGDLGKRTILAGIRKSYTPEELVGKRGLFITNLKPRKMAGTESQGMMLVAEDENGKMQLVQFADVVKNGVRLR